MFRKCPDCEVNLDPGETCDCRKENAAHDGANIESGADEIHHQQNTKENQFCQ